MADLCLSGKVILAVKRDSGGPAMATGQFAQSQQSFRKPIILNLPPSSIENPESRTPCLPACLRLNASSGACMKCSLACSRGTLVQMTVSANVSVLCMWRMWWLGCRETVLTCFIVQSPLKTCGRRLSAQLTKMPAALAQLEGPSRMLDDLQTLLQNIWTFIILICIRSLPMCECVRAAGPWPSGAALRRLPMTFALSKYRIGPMWSWQCCMLLLLNGRSARGCLKDSALAVQGALGVERVR